MCSYCDIDSHESNQSSNKYRERDWSSQPDWERANVRGHALSQELTADLATFYIFFFILVSVTPQPGLALTSDCAQDLQSRGAVV